MADSEAELAADALWQARASAVSEMVVGDGRVRLTADVAALHLVPARWGARVVDPRTDAYLDAYLDTWREWAVPRRAGRRVVLQPTWLDRQATLDHDDDVVVWLDPGRSFGSGSHPSTRLVLAILEERLPGGARVLDVGCGSGVLAVTACLLGAAEVVALDLDADAVSTTRANAARNAVAASVQASTRAVADVEGDFDMVVANIGAGVLCDLAPALWARVAPGGLLVLAGMLDAQADAVAAAQTGCVEEERRTDDGWAALVLRA